MIRSTQLASLGVALICVAHPPSTAQASSLSESGTVELASSRWTPDRTAIVTDVVIRSQDGSLIELVELGGSVGGIAMSFSHTMPLEPGDNVAIKRAGDGISVSLLSRANAVEAPRRSADAGSARYGLKRTNRSGVPLRPSSCLSFVYDERGLSDIRGQRVNELLDRAIDAWTASESCSAPDISTSVGDAAAAGLVQNNTVSFREESWCRPETDTEPELCYAEGAAATTRTIYIDRPGDASDGLIIASHIDLNAVNFAFFDDGMSYATEGEPVDFLSVVTHEIGHAFGLAHNCATGAEVHPRDQHGAWVPRCADVADDPTFTAATMYFSISRGETHKRTPEADDRLAICAVFSGNDCNLSTGPIGCQVGDGAGVAAPVLLLIMLLCWRQRATFATLVAFVSATACQLGDAALPSADEEPPATAAHVEGTVIDAFSGEALADVVISTLGFSEEMSALSDADGTFRLAGVPLESQYFVTTETSPIYRRTTSLQVFRESREAIEVPRVAISDAERWRSTLGVSSESLGVLIVELVTRSGAPASAVPLSEVALSRDGNAIPAAAAFFGPLGDLDSEIGASVVFGGKARVGFVALEAGDYTIEVGAASRNVELGLDEVMMVSLDITPPGSLGASFADVYQVLGRSSDGGAGCANCHRHGGPGAVIVFDGEPASVHQAIVSGGFVDIDRPLSSPLVRKPLYEVPGDHPNATWLDESEPGAAILVDWIAAGAVFD